MFMADDKKKKATIIISKMDGQPEKMEEAPKNENGDEVDDSMAYDAASEELMDAVHSKDIKALKHALKAFVDMCMNDEPESQD